MVGWYSPLQLLRTAREVIVSSLFGRHADFRLIEALASNNAPDVDTAPADSGLAEFWLDYVADTGDGWNPTYAVAYWLAQPTLQLRDARGEKHLTQRAQLLVFGGDEVYPFASKPAYKDRLIAPYETALGYTEAPHPVVYAVPGNHDWYDSLVAFTRLFCSGVRGWFGGWEAKQRRSYFAVKLPGGWWLVGTDMQLGADIDDAQVDFFRHKVRPLMQPTDRIILCHAEPHWIFSHLYGYSDPARGESRLRTLRDALYRADSSYSEKNLHFLEEDVFQRQIAVFLAGDLHHYRRHAVPDGKQQKIVAGGGGAFLHPTHGPNVELLEDGYELKASYPPPEVSKRLCWRNLLFPLLNPGFGLLPAVVYLLTAMLIRTDLSALGPADFATATLQTINAALNRPGAMIWLALIVAGFVLFTDTHFRVYRVIAGLLHAFTNLLAAFLIGWGATCLSVGVAGLPYSSSPQILLASALVFGAGWLMGSILMGLYLLISLNALGRHYNEAFSSLKIQDWKNFLRIRVKADGSLTIFPIGLRRVPRKWKARAEAGQWPQVQPDDGRATVPELIEPPVELNFLTRKSM